MTLYDENGILLLNQSNNKGDNNMVRHFKENDKILCNTKGKKIVSTEIKADVTCKKCFKKLNESKHFRYFKEFLKGDLMGQTKGFWAMKQCKSHDEAPVRAYITGSKDAYYYCWYIKNRPEMRKKIKVSKFALEFCQNVDDDPEVAKNITDSKDRMIYEATKKRC